MRAGKQGVWFDIKYECPNCHSNMTVMRQCESEDDGIYNEVKCLICKARHFERELDKCQSL